MNTISKVKRISAQWGFTVAMISFTALVGLASYAIFEFHEFTGGVVHTNDVLDVIQHLQTMAERAESGQRGYSLTHKEQALITFRNSVSEINPALEELKFLVIDNDAQEERVRHFAQIVNQHLLRLEQINESERRRNSLDYGKEIDLDQVGEIRDAADAIEKEEFRLLALRRKRAEGMSEFSILFMSFGALISLGFMLIGRRTLSRSQTENLNQALLLNSIFDSVGDGLMVIDRVGKCTHFNNAARALMGVDMLGVTAEKRLEAGRAIDPATGTLLKIEDSPLSRALKGESVDGFEVINKVLGPARTLCVDARPVLDSRQNIVGGLALFYDTTAQKNMERDWKMAREAALEASRLKSEFLATMSHEIRTPMNGVIGMSTLLLETPLNQEQISFVKTIKSSADNLLTLINQILDHSKIESGKFELKKDDFKLQDCIEGVVEMFRYLARSRNIELQLSLDSKLPQVVQGDAGRLRQILINLIGNALKFTDHGYVRLNVTIKSHTESAYRVMFEVQDTGQGIPQAVQARLFQKFSQGDSKDFVMQGGSGLGLMISRELVHLMGGEIGLESIPEIGSKFWFHAEFGSCTEVPTKMPAPELKRQQFVGKVLIAEDQSVNQIVIRKYLELFGLTSDLVSDGESAVKLVNTNRFDLVFMDCKMPIMTGYTATEQIRAFEAQNGGHIPIVALTAEGQSGDRKRCFEVGMDDFLTKPIDLNELTVILSKYLKSQAPSDRFNRAVLEGLAVFDSGGRSLALVLIDDFLKTGPELVNSLCVALKTAEHSRVSDLAHALKSTCLTLGMTQMGELCQKLEDHPEDLVQAAELKGALNEAISWLRAFAHGKASQVA